MTAPTATSRHRKGPALADPDLFRPFDRRQVERALPHEPGARSDRPVGRLRSADPDRLRQRPSAGQGRGRQGRRADQPSRRHAHPVRRHPARPHEHVDDDQRAGGVAALALHRAAEAQGVERAKLQGTTQNDIIKEYLCARDLHLPARAVAAADRRHDRLHLSRGSQVEPDERLQLSPAGSRRDADAGAGLRARPTRSPCSTRCARAARCPRPTSRRWSAASRSSSTPASASSPRSARCGRSPSCGTTSPRNRYGVADAKQRLFRYGVQVNSLGLTEQQPENNVYRILLEMLAVVMSKNARARSVQLPAWNEALGLPRPWDQQWSLRLQQIVAFETDLLEYGDIFDGSSEIAAKVEALKDEALAEMQRIADMGGAVAAIESAYMKQRLVEIEPQAPRRHRGGRADRGRRQRLHRERALAAQRRRRRDPDRRRLGRARAGRAPERLARRARRRAP